MASFNVEQEWQRSLFVLELTENQWKDRMANRNVLSEEEMLRINMSFAEIKYFVDSHSKNAECLVGFHERFNKLNFALATLAVKMGLNVTIIDGKNF